MCTCKIIFIPLHTFALEYYHICYRRMLTNEDTEKPASFRVFKSQGALNAETTTRRCSTKIVARQITSSGE